MSDNEGNQNNNDAADYRRRADAELEKQLMQFRLGLFGGVSRRAVQTENVAEQDGKAADGTSSDDMRGVHGGHRLRLRKSVRNDAKLDGFSDVELVETLLSYLIPQKDTNVTAHALLNRYGTVLGVLRAPTEELVKFSAVTECAARTLPMLALACLYNGERELKIHGPNFAARFFGKMTEGLREGTYAAYLDGKFRLIAFERCDDSDILPSREIICAADRCKAEYVLPLRREPDIYPDAFGLTAHVEKLSAALDSMNKRLLDFLLFTEYGHYTLGTPPIGGGWYAQYIFVPSASYAEAEVVDDDRDMAAEVAAVISGGAYKKDG